MAFDSSNETTALEATPGQGVAPLRNPLWREGHLVTALAALTLIMLAVPLTFARPGMPPNLKADEAAYYGMARSLANDFDLEFTERDSQRFFDEYPYRFVRNLVLMSDDGWRTVYYGKPHVYSLVAAPFARLFGANGMLLLNALLFCLSMWMGVLYLARRVSPGQAAMFSVGFFFLSAAFRYVFWLQPEIFSLFCITSCLFFGFDRRFPTARMGIILMFVSGCALAPATYNKPMFAAIAVPVVLPALLEGYRKRVVAWGLGFVVTMSVLCGIGLLLTGKASPYLGVEQRQGTTVCTPDAMPPEVLALRQSAAAAAPAASSAASAESSVESPTGNSFSWLFRFPQVGLVELLQNLGYFLWGRHAGLFPYFPFTALALYVFFRHSRGSFRRWLLLGSLLVVALYFLIWIGWNWQGGGGFVGNRYFVSLVPGFLFLVERLRLRQLLVTSVLAGFLVGPLVLTPLGAGVPEPTMQSHARNIPLRWLPLELSLRNVPGYNQTRIGDLRVRGRSDQVLPFGDQLWLHGGASNELHLLTDQPLDRGIAILLVSEAAPNHIAVRMGGDKGRFDVVDPGQAAVLVLHPRPLEKLRQYGEQQLVYRMTVAAERGKVVTWVKQWQRPRCTEFAFNETTNESFYLGARLLLLGEPEVLERPVFDVDWLKLVAPRAMKAGAKRTLPVRIRNSSAAEWPTLATASGAARVKIAYHWLTSSPQPGTTEPETTEPETTEPLEMLDRNSAVVWDGERSEIDVAMPAGAEARVEVEVRAPAEPGLYRLVLDPVFEHVGWFSDDGRLRNTHSLPVVVEP